MVKGMWNYAVKTDDLERATRFYLECLGAELRISSEVLGCTYNLIRVGESRLILFDKGAAGNRAARWFPPRGL